MIENKCTQWYESEQCTVKNLIEYIDKTGQMRDVQIEAIKVYLFLKITCECKPLTQLFRQGFFNSIDLNEIELSKSTHEYLFQNPAAAALFEYACLTNDKGEQVSEKLEKQIKKDPTGIDYNEFFRNAFYGVSYTDYLFSLPMGAGKTYLMGAFIYLDLYFAYNEPTNPAFAHNFIIFAPSGLKSSVVPSLKTIKNFNPSWILPEPAATDLKRMISFEVLDQSKTAKKSNKTKNPNVQKIANHQPLSELFGLVAVTNAEKVILDRIQEKQGQINMFEESDDDKDRQVNELRNLIGKLPSLSIFIDEVHHDIDEDEKAFSGMNCIKLAIQNCGKAIDEDAEITFEVPKESLLTLGEFPKFNNAEMGYLLTDCDMSILFGIEGTSEYIEYSESEQNGRTPYGARPYGLPGYVPDYGDDFTDELKDVFCYAFYSSENKYIVKLKVDYIKHNTTVAFPTILLVKNKIDEIPYKITSKNIPDVVEGCIKVKS